MNEFLLPLFPPEGLASSVITTVWVGVAVVAFFNLRLGWVLSGLVVPGYLVPLLMVKPWAVAVIFLESAVTYFLAWLFSEYLSRTGAWGSLFGRDRFFAIVLFSIIVRLLFDGWLLPELGQWLNQELNLVFDYRNNLHSFGLIIIALMANLYWKTGFRKALVPLFVTVGVSYFIVRFGLMEFTNFTISNLSYMYEDIAASILASPKAYLILLTVAFFASRMNLLYGWDFSGILIPSLLALQWYQPHKLFTSFLEAFVILLVAHWLLQTRLYRNANIEGARKLLLFFNIGFAYKLTLGFLILHFLPGLKVTDSYGFGYLLSTLMAVKMHDKGIAARFTRATLQTSLVGVVIASVIGFSLTFLPLDAWWYGPGRISVSTLVQEPSDKPLRMLVRDDKVLLYQAQERGQTSVPLTHELDLFGRALKALKSYLRQGDEEGRNLATSLLAEIGYQLLEVEGRYLYLRELSPARGWGLYVLDRQGPNGLVVEVPLPLDERGTLEAGLALFSAMEAGGLAVAGTKRDINPDGSADVLLNRQSLFHVFHQTMAQHDAVQVRTYTRSSARTIAGGRGVPGAVDVQQASTSLWIKGNLPPGLDLVKLKGLLEQLQVEWGSLPLANRQRELSRKGFAELVLSQASMRKLRARSVPVKSAPQLLVSEQRIDGFLSEWLLGEKGGMARRGSNAYLPPRLDELLYFDEEILTPLLATARMAYTDGRWSPAGLEELAAIQSAALAFDYRLSRYRHQRTGEDFLILFEDEAAMPRRHWGTYVFRLGPARGYLVQVPRPLYEINSFEYGVSLFERLKARALMVAGADPGANLDGSANLVRLEHLRSLFSLVNQVVLRESGDDPMLVIHSRARGYRPELPQLPIDALLSVVGEVGSSSLSHPLIQGLVGMLEADGFSYGFVDGRPATAGYEVGGIAQSLYLNATQNKLFSAIWLSPEARLNFRQQDLSRQENARFRSLDITTSERDLGAFIVQESSIGRSAALPPLLRETIQRYQVSGDIVTLARLDSSWPGYRWERVIDRDSRQSFLTVFDRQARLMLVANLNPNRLDAAVRTSRERPDRMTIARFIETRSALLEFGVEG